MAQCSAELTQGLTDIAHDVEQKVKKLSDEFNDGKDLAQGLGAAAGTVFGGIYGGAQGAVAGNEFGKLIGSMFILKIEMSTVTFSLNIPVVTLKDVELQIPAPVIAIHDQDLSFDLPTVENRDQAGPDIPQTVCRNEIRELPFGVKITVPVCYIEMKPTTITVPVVVNKTQHILIGIPDIRIEMQRIVFGFPIIEMRLQSYSFDVPHVTLEFVQDAGKKLASEAQKVTAEAQTNAMTAEASLRERLRFKLVGPCTEMFECYKQTLVATRGQIAAMFDPAIQQMTTQLSNMAASGVPTTHADYLATKQGLDGILAQRSKAIADIEAQLQELDRASAAALEAFINKDPEDESPTPA